MKKIIIMLALLAVLIASFSLISCSSSTGGGENTSEPGVEKFVGKYKGNVTNGTDTVKCKVKIYAENGTNVITIDLPKSNWTYDFEYSEGKIHREGKTGDIEATLSDDKNTLKLIYVYEKVKWTGDLPRVSE